MVRLLLFSLILSAQTGPDFSARHARDLATNPSDLTFRIRTAKPAYRIGERIRIELMFSSSSPDKYKLNGATYDRSGRLPTEEFVLEGERAVDPFDDFFNNDLFGGMAGGLRTNPVLSPTPHVIEVTMNDWFRFDSSGLYRLYLKSHRLAHGPAVSNLLNLEILPADAAWEANLLEGSTDPLDLRYLATPPAIRAAFTRARGTVEPPDVLTLIGARDRAAMLLEFDEYLADPDVAFTTWDIHRRTFFRYSQLGNRSLPAASVRGKLFNILVQKEAVRLIPVAQRKSEEARKESAVAIVHFALEEAVAAGLVPAYDYGMTREQLIAGFLEFPAERQRELLSDKWDVVRGPEMIPILAELCTRDGVAEPAMGRLLQLDARRAQTLLRADVAKPNPLLTQSALRHLPAQAIPEADKFVEARMKKDLPLLARFGSVDLAPRMRAAYRTGKMACATEEVFLSYFLRVQPETGMALLETSMNSRENRGCHHSLLGAASRGNWTPALKARVIEALQDPDPETVLDATRVLSTRGEADVEPHLWKRLEEWSAHWSGRGAELRRHPVTGNDPNLWERNLGDALFNAFGSAKSWILDQSRRTRLYSLCIDEECRERWAPARQRGPVEIRASNGGAIYGPAFHIEGYAAASIQELMNKLRQYEAHSRFAWKPDSFSSYTAGELATMLSELRAAFPGRIDQ